MDMNKEELIELQKTFQKCANIIGEIIEITETIENTKDEGELKKLAEIQEEKLGVFMVQMLKLSNLK